VFLLRPDRGVGSGPKRMVVTVDCVENSGRRVYVSVLRRDTSDRRPRVVTRHAACDRGNPAWSMDGVAAAVPGAEPGAAWCGDHAHVVDLPGGPAQCLSDLDHHGIDVRLGNSQIDLRPPGGRLDRHADRIDGEEAESRAGPDGALYGCAPGCGVLC